MRKAFLVIVLLIVSSVFLSADYYIKKQVKTGSFAIMGKTEPEKNETNEMWLGENKMAMHSEGQSFIVDLDKKVAYMVNHANKSYIEMVLPIDMAQYIPEEMAPMAQMMLNVTITVNPTGETQQIGTWNCSGYDVEMNMMMLKMKMKIWASQEVPFDWKTFGERMYAEMAKAMMRMGDDAVKEFMKIEGFQIKSEMSMNMMGTDITTTDEVVEISEKAAPAGTYLAPEGYTKQDKLTKEDLMKKNTP